MNYFSGNKEDNDRVINRSRRNFFGHIGGLLAGGALVVSGIKASPARSETLKSGGGSESMDQKHTNTFSPYVGDTFHITIDSERSMKVTLIEVIDRTPRVNQHAGAAKSPRQECYSVLFQGAADHPLPQATYAFTHPGMGKIDIFIVPVGRDKESIQYEAVFNTLIA